MALARRLPLLTASLIYACDCMTLRASQAPNKPEALRNLAAHYFPLATSTKTMAVQGHTVSEVSTRWTGNVVYAIFTSKGEAFHEKVIAQLDTWAAAPAAEGRYVAVGGKDYPTEWQNGSVVLRSECEDDILSISCKEATLLAEGAARGADWLVVVGEDQYVHTGHVEEAMKSKNPDEAVAYGSIGCGKGLYCHENLWFEKHGGFCGGCGYIISRAALQKLLVDGAPSLHAVYDNITWPNDMTTSCQLRKHGSELRVLEGLYGYPMVERVEYQGMARSDFLTAHYLNPTALRWMHAQIQGEPDNSSLMQRLEGELFDRGCARDMKVRESAHYKRCLENPTS